MGTYDPMPTDGSTGWGTWLRNAIGDLDARILAYELGMPIIPSPAYPAAGNSVHTTGGADATGTDDYTVVQDALADAQGGANGILLRSLTYRIVGTLDMGPDKSKYATSIYSFGNAANSNIGPGACLLYDGTTGGTLLTNRVTGQNIPFGMIHDVALRGYASKGGRAVEMGSTTTTAAKPDTNSGFKNVWFGNWTAEPVLIDSDGVTSMTVEDCRFDACKGRFRVRIVSDTYMRFINNYVDNNNLPGGGTADGWLLFDCSAIGANTRASVRIDGAKIECHSNLTDVAAALNSDYGTADEADKRGLIQVIVNPSQTRTQMKLTMDQINLTGNTGRATHALVLPLGGTELNRRARIAVYGRMWEGFFGAGTAATGHFLPIAGIPDADKANAIVGAIDGWLPEVKFWPGGDNLAADEDAAAYVNV